MKIAIIFAAGGGTRLRPLTTEIHKSLIKFNNLPLIEYTINNLLQVKNLTKIIIITGYLKNDFNYLKEKYHNIILVNNNYYHNYNSAYALKLVASYFIEENDIFIIAGDMVSSNNNFIQNFNTNCMAAIKRDKNNKKVDWSYTLDKNNNIIDISKSANKNSLLAGEWAYITGNWSKILGQDLRNPDQELILQITMVGKYLINNSINHHLPLKSYILDFNTHWDLDTNSDLERTNNFFK